jgi:phospholipid/cholesterol/gamma-HCH transport system substrate-binding protein
MNRTTLDLWVGFFVAIGIGALLFLALRVGSFSSASMEESYELEARFDSIGGLKVRGPVKSAGVVVGRIARIHLDPGTYEARVVLVMDARYTFPKDTLAAIYTSGLLGDQYIGLEPGSETKKLAPGETIFKTRSAVVLEKLLSQFGSPGIGMEKSYELQARFDNIGSLKVGGPVKSAGVVVGRVSGIHFDPGAYEARVTLAIDARYAFPKDTFASIYTSGLLGDQYIGLEPGGDTEKLAAGDTIFKTQSAVVLEKLVSQFLFNKAAEGQDQK